MQNKEQLIEAAKKTFFAYLKLDFAREFLLNINDAEITLTDYVQELLDSETLSAENNEHHCNIAGSDCIIKFKDNEIILKNNDADEDQPPLKDITDYEENEVLNLLSNTRFTLTRHKKNNNLQFALPIKIRKKSFVLGGAEKYELYRSHLVTLHKMINHLEAHDDIKAMLVALTTGSGKTFVQALWYLTLQFANIKGIFAQPKNLLDQFRSDLKNLLPDELVDEMGSAEDMDTHPFILDAYEELLDNHFDTIFENDDDSDTALIFDEQHQVMEDESRRVKLKALAHEKLCLFLTATPTKETFEMCDQKPVALMSALEKQLEGQGSFSRVVTLKAQTLREKMKSIEMALKERIRVTLLIPIFDSLMGEHNPPTAWTAFKDLALRIQVNDPENNDGTREFLRNNIEMPVKHKILFLTDSTDELINIWEFVRSNYLPSLYENGGESLQNNGFFYDVPGAYDQAQEEAFKTYLNQIDPDNLLNHQPMTLSAQLQKTIYHNMVDSFLSEITGLSTIELNQLRKKDLAKLVELVKAKFNENLHCQPRYLAFKLNIKHNPKGIDEEGANAVGGIFAGFGTAFKEMSDETKEKFIDNWSFDEDIYQQMQSAIYELNDFTKRHCTMFIMKGKKSAETPIEDNAVFFDFETEKVPVYDENMLPSKEAKRRKKSFFEQLDKDTIETHYKPKTDPNITETIADNYFKNGFVGMYISNDKWQGLNVNDLHTVVCTLTHSADAFNEPAKKIQSIGRNRGLDPTITPYYIQSFGKNCENTFDLKLLETTNQYYPLYFKAEKKYQKLFIKHLAKTVAEEITRGLSKNDDVSLKWLSLRAVVKALRALNNKNAHNIKLSRSQLSTLLRYVKKEIAREIDALKKPYLISPNILALFSLMHGVFSILYFFKTLKLHINLFQKTRESKAALKKASDENNQSDVMKHQAELLYSKILNLRYSTLGAQTLTLEETFNALMQLDDNSAEEDLNDYLLHPQFYKACKNTIGAFSLAELQLLINILQDKALNEENQDAIDLYQFLNALKHKNVEDIDKESLLSTTLPLIKALHEELKNIHMHFLQLEGRGSSKLSELISASGIPDIHIIDDMSTLQEVMGKISTLYPLISGMSGAGQIKAIQHKPQIKTLERVSQHIITPLKRSSNLSQLQLWLAQLGKKIAATLSFKRDPTPDEKLEVEDTVDNSIDSYSSITEAFDKAKKPSLSDAEIKTDYEKDAYDTGLRIRKLQAYTLNDVCKPDCKVDAIQDIIDHIDIEESKGLSVKTG